MGASKAGLTVRNKVLSATRIVPQYMSLYSLYSELVTIHGLESETIYVIHILIAKIY